MKYLRLWFWLLNGIWDVGDEEMKNETYEQFVEKFKPKKTTDDCYTPKKIYDAVVQFVKDEYGIGDRKIVRPFWPGGDYERFEYDDGCIVIDNPPFSILSKIIDFYMKKGIGFFCLLLHWLYSRR